MTSRPHHLGRKIDELAPPRRGLAAQGQEVLPVIFLEGLEQKEAYQQEVIVGLIGGQALERELLAAQFLPATKGQLIGATLMMVIDQGGILLPVFPHFPRHPFPKGCSGN